MAREPQTLAWKGFLAHSVVRNEPSTFICTLKRCKLWTVCGGALATQNASSQQAFTLGQKTSTVVGIFVARQKRRYCYLSNGCEQYLGENRTELKMVVTHIVTDK